MIEQVSCAYQAAGHLSGLGPIPGLVAKFSLSLELGATC